MSRSFDPFRFLLINVFGNVIDVQVLSFHFFPIISYSGSSVECVNPECAESGTIASS